jgi:hypothetical protein
MFIFKLIVVVDGWASSVSERFYILWGVALRRGKVVSIVKESSHVQPSSLMVRAKPLAGFSGDEDS